MLLALSATAAEPMIDWEKAKAKAETLLHFQSIVRIDTSRRSGSQIGVKASACGRDLKQGIGGIHKRGGTFSVLSLDNFCAWP